MESKIKKSQAQRRHMASLSQAARKHQVSGAIAKVVALGHEFRQTVPTENMGHDCRRRTVIEEQKDCCLRCGLDEWLGERLVLELDHIDGNNANNVRSNLRALCPNCHSLTPTWRGKMRS